MPGRIIPLITGEIYHVFNRGIARQPTFIRKKEFERALLAINFYKHSLPIVKLSKFLVKRKDEQDEIMDMLKKGEKLVEIFTFCFMTNHFHFLTRQIKDGGISKFVGNFQNSYTRYFNTKNERDGSLFLDQFKAIRIETDEQLIHVSRYIHLNPYTSYVTDNFDELTKYPWSSLREYLLHSTNSNSICTTEFILKLFDNKVNTYKKFILNQADYQRKLDIIQHLIIE